MGAAGPKAVPSSRRRSSLAIEATIMVEDLLSVTGMEFMKS
jgi:hypothetical protein